MWRALPLRPYKRRKSGHSRTDAQSRFCCKSHRREGGIGIRNNRTAKNGPSKPTLAPDLGSILLAEMSKILLQQNGPEVDISPETKAFFRTVRAPAEGPYLTKLFCSGAAPSGRSSGTSG